MDTRPTINQKFTTNYKSNYRSNYSRHPIPNRHGNLSMKYLKDGMFVMVPFAATDDDG